MKIRMFQGKIFNENYVLDANRSEAPIYGITDVFYAEGDQQNKIHNWQLATNLSQMVQLVKSDEMNFSAMRRLEEWLSSKLEGNYSLN